MADERDPRMFVDQNLARQVRTISNNAVPYFDIPPQRDMAYPDGKIPIVKSLDLFSKYINGNGLSQIIMEHTRVGRFMRKEMPDGSEFIAGAFGWCQRLCSDSAAHPFGCNMSRSIDRDALYYVDGDYGFSIGVKCPDLDYPLWCAITSFMFTGRINLVSDSLKLGDSLPDIAPIIVQFQGSNFSDLTEPEKNRRSKGILGRIPWEYLLGSLTINWWRNICNDPIYFLPPYQNHFLNNKFFNSDSDRERINKAITKIETVANDLNFVVDPQSGLYKLSD